MALESDGGGGNGDGAAEEKRRRVDEQGGQRKEEAAPVLGISALPEDLRRRILTHLPLKDAIRTGALAQGWRDLWKSRWSEPTSCLDIHLLPGDKPSKVLRLLESGPRHRLDRFSLVADNQRLRNNHLKRFLAYAAECRVEGLQIDLRCCKPGEKFNYRLALSSPLLAHLSLRNINICEPYLRENAQPFCALEVIRLHSVTSDVTCNTVLALCPRLRILDLRRCCCTLFWPVGMRRLRSFRYSGSFDSYPDCIPWAAAIADLYICFDKPMPTDRCQWNRIFPANLSGLTVLSVCSNALKAASFLLSDRPYCRWDKMSKLPSLKELQLLMHEMERDNLADIYRLIKSCHFSNLERLFVQLPATSDVPLMDLAEEVSVELPGDGLVKLGMVKVMNFHWRRFEVQLVSLLLRKVTSLNKLLLVSPDIGPLPGPGVQEADADLLILKAWDSGRVIISESDDPEIQPFHPEILIEE